MLESKNFKAILFDLDGTLVDTLEDLSEIMNTVLRRRGLPTHPKEAYKQMVGWGLRSLAEKSLPEGRRDEETVSECEEELVSLYFKTPVVKTKPYPGIPELLNKLTGKKIPMGILTNKTHHLAEEVVNRLLSSWEFVLIRGSIPGKPKKPDPSVAIEFCEKVGIPPEKTFFLGDSNIDMKTAVAAGMFPAGALWGFRTAEELKESGAKVLLSSPEEVISYFDKQRR